MQLASVTGAPSDDLRYMVREVKAIKLFYVTTGRNAWWSTWVTSYTEGCMHTTFASARKYCESRRVQGTVFYVTQLPALAFVAEGRVLAVTEINTKDILGRFNLAKLNDITTVLPVSIMTLRQISLLFRSQSPLWSEDFPQEDSAILTFCAPVDRLVDCGTGDDLVEKASRSDGGGYELEWSERPFTADPSKVIALAASLKDKLSEVRKRHIRLHEHPQGVFNVVGTPEALTMQELPEEMQEKLAILRTAPIGFHEERTGRRVSDDVFYVYVYEKITPQDGPVAG